MLKPATRVLRGPSAAATQLRASMHWPVAGAVLLIGALSFAAKLAVVAKDAVVAQFFGTGDALDAFLIAFLLPSFAVNVIAGSLQTAFLPTYVRVRDREGQFAATQLLSQVISCAVAMLLVVTVVCVLIGASVLEILGAGFSPEKLVLTRTLFYLLLPTLFITGVSTIWAATLNAGERFGVVAAAPIITPVLIIAAVLGQGSSATIYALAAGTLLGAAGEAALIGYRLAHDGKLAWPVMPKPSPALRQVLDQFLPMIAAAFLMSSTTFIDQSMAARLGSGSVSALNYGNRLITGVLGISSVALGTAVFPHFAKRIAAGDRTGATSMLKTYALLIAGISVPLVLFFVFWSSDITRVLFERGSFTATDTRLVARIQTFYALQIPFYLVGLLGVRFISSLQGNRILLIIAALSLIANVTGNIIFMRLYGAAGIALSTAVVYLLSCTMIFLAIYKLLAKHE